MHNGQCQFACSVPAWPIFSKSASVISQCRYILQSLRQRLFTSHRDNRSTLQDTGFAGGSTGDSRQFTLRTWGAAALLGVAVRMPLVCVLATLALLQTGVWAQSTPYSDRCRYGMDGFPPDHEVGSFMNRLQGDLYWLEKAGYQDHVVMNNVRQTRYPYYVVMCETVGDVREAMLFARRYNLAVAIRSSGHSFPGRSTVAEGLVINLQRMQGISVQTTSSRSAAGEVTVESGCTWAKVYEEVNRHGRVVVGGSAHTVAMGGYTQGGGHSPLSRTLGLAVDNLLAAQILTVDGRLINVTENDAVVLDPSSGAILEHVNGSDLFWALRGGGGGVWGVVTTFTFKLHFPPSGFVQYVAIYPMIGLSGEDLSRQFLSPFFDLMPNLPREWGGYFLLFRNPHNANGNYILLTLLHYGDWNAPTRQAIQPIVDIAPNLTLFSQFNNFSTFWDYERGVNDSQYTNAYVFNTLLHNSSLTSSLLDVLGNLESALYGQSGIQCTGVLLGGKTAEPEVADLPVSPHLRRALTSFSCGVGWDYRITDSSGYIRAAQAFASRLRAHGQGVYYNEPDEEQPNWRNEFWDGKYERLLEVKRRWDPDGFLWCKECVGDDPLPAPQQRTCSGSNRPLGGTALLMVALVLGIGLRRC